ncbi:MAG: hypothetical protein ACRDP6_15265, partial [Actinoallomurus sp.]
MAEGSARVIVVLGDIPATGHFAKAEALRGPALTSPDDAAPVFLDLVARSLPAMSEGILVVYPEWQAEAAKRVIRLTRGMLDTDQVASIGLQLPPLACSVVADLLSLAAPHLQIGYLAGLARRLQDELLSGARLATVAKLEHIDTKLTQHMASYSPGSGFLAWATPEGRIDRISRRKKLAPLEFRPTEPVHLLVAPYGPDFPEFEKELSASLRPQSVTTVAAQPLGADFWGTRKHVEFVAFSGHPQALADIARSTRYWMCRWCRQPASLEICAICAMYQDDARAAAPVPQTVPAGSGSSAEVHANGHRSAPHERGLPTPVPSVFLTEQPVPAAPAEPVPAEPVPAEAAPSAPAVTVPQAGPPAVPFGGPPEPVPTASVPSVGRGVVHNGARPGAAADDERAVPFGKGGFGKEPAAGGG